MGVGVESKGGWSGAAGVAMAPLTWLERARGRKRLALVVLYGLVLVVAGVLGWRALSLRGLPDMGEPFDPALGSVRVPDAENAFVVYREAVARLKQPHPAGVPSNPKAWDETDWSKADPPVRQWVEENREALELWRRGTDRRDALLVQPKDLTIESPLSAIQELRTFTRLALLEGSRREQAGDLDGAWSMYRAVPRSSRHAGMHGPAIARLVGTAMLRKSEPSVSHWAEHPRQSSASLRRALADLDECAAMTPPVSEMVRAEYFATRSALSRPEKWRNWGVQDMDDGLWYNHFPALVRARRFLRREPERSRRVLDLLVAGHLAQCDRPRERRAKLVVPDLMIYAPDPATPAALRALSPRALETWARSSALWGLLPALGNVQGRVEGDRYILDALRLTLAERAYRLDHGSPPPTYGALLGRYLTTLPDGYDPADPPGPPAGEPKPATGR
jgi:hypothetical protein